MDTQIVDLKCPNCGAAVETGQKTCEYCKQPVIISTFNSVYTMPLPMINKYASAYKKAMVEYPDSQELNNSIAMCYLKLRMHDKALKAFEKAIEDNFDNSETYFYCAITLLNGKKAFLANRGTIDKIEAYLEAAKMIEPKAIYTYFQSYVKYDYYFRKCYKTSPDYNELLIEAKNTGISNFDVTQLFEILGVPQPGELAI